MTIIAVVGMKREARIVAGEGVRVITGGGDGDGLQRRLAAAIGDGTSGIVSVGIAGALSPSLQIGDCAVASAVIDGSSRIVTDAAWTARLRARLPHTKPATIFGAHEPIWEAAKKAELGTGHGADIVDMESGYAAREAVARNLPFAALRVISDAATDTLPPATLVAMRPDGGIALNRVLWSIAKNPAQIPALIRTGRNADKAFAELLRCLGLLGPGLGCPYLG